MSNTIFRPEWCKTLREQECTPEERCEFYEAVISYCDDGSIPTFSSKAASLAFAMIKPILSNDVDKYENKCAANRENGKRGGRPRTQVVSEETQRNPVGFLGYSENPSEPNETKSISKSISISKSESIEENKKENIVCNAHTREESTHKPFFSCKRNPTEPYLTDEQVKKNMRDIANESTEDEAQFLGWLYREYHKLALFEKPITLHQYEELCNKHTEAKVLRIMNQLNAKSDIYTRPNLYEQIEVWIASDFQR